jgi:thioesterase superfamily protein
MTIALACAAKRRENEIGMANTNSELSDARRALLAKYLRGEVPIASKGNRAVERPQPAAGVEPDDKSRAPAVALRATGSKTPFFFPHVHWEGGAAYCFSLANDLGPDQPFYLIEPCRIDDFEAPPSLTDIAAECVKSMRAIQAQGPYRLGGYCGSGFIQFEMAQQLQAAGQQVDKLVMIEPGVGPYHAPLLGWVGALVARVGTALRLTPDQQLSWFLYMRHVYKLARYPAYRTTWKLSLAPTREELRKDWLGTFVWIVSTYAPLPYRGKVAYIWAQDDAGSHRDWWRKRFVAQETEDHFTTGDRSNCRNDTHVHDLAKQLQVCLADR